MSLVEAASRPEAELLLLSGRSRLAGSSARRVEALLASRLDWSYLLWVGHRQAMLPRLHPLARFGGVPAPVEAQLRSYAEANARRMAAAEDDLAAILALLRSASIRALPLRAAAWVASTSSGVPMRDGEPGDLLLAPGDAGRVRPLLTARGYEPLLPQTPTRDAAIRQARGAIVLRHVTSGARLRLHDQIAPAFFPVGLDLEALRPRRREASLAGRTVAIPANEDLVLLLCLHGAVHLWDRLAWLSDLDTVLAA